MSDIQDKVMEVAEPRLKELADTVQANFFKRWGEFVEAAHKDTLEERFKSAATAKLNALTAKTTDEARQWAETYATTIRSIETLGLSAKIVADAKAASFWAEAIDAALETMAGVAAGILQTVVSGVVSGAISGMTGGSGGDVIGGLADVVGGFLGSADA